MTAVQSQQAITQLFIYQHPHMLDILEHHLKVTLPVEQFDEYMHACELLEKLGVDSDEGDDALVMEYANGNMENLASEFHSALYSRIHDVLRAHGMGMSLEASIAHIIPVLEFFVLIENTELIQEVDDIVSNDLIGPEEKFAMCVSTVAGCEVEFVIPHLTEIPNSVITGIKRYTLQRLAVADHEDDYQAADRAQVLKSLNAYVALVNGNQMKCYEHANIHDVALDLPLEYYWGIYKDYLLSIPVKAMVLELIGFCLISDRRDADPTTTVLGVLNSHFGDDIDKSTEINMIIRQTLMNIQTSANSGLFVKPGAANG